MMHEGGRLLELVFAYLAGLLTLINPCVLPVLPIVLLPLVVAVEEPVGRVPGTEEHERDVDAVVGHRS